jgi:hypothetical protein
VAIDGELCVFALPYSNITFRATFVKLYLIPNIQIDSIKVKPINKDLIELTSKEPVNRPVNKQLAPLLVKRGKRRLRKNLAIIVFL